MPHLPAFPNFRPVSIVDQVATVLRDAVHRGTWGHYLPGEHELTRQLGVSRPTVHRALMVLAKDGLIATSHGRRTRILSDDHIREVSPTVCVVAPAQREILGLIENPLLLALRTQLLAQGIGWEEVFDVKLAGRSPERRLERLVKGRRSVCWLLVVGTAAVQRWFENINMPALVLGSCHPGVHLPSVDWDYRALGWHAAGCLTRQGHRHIAVILRGPPMPGDLACRDGVAHYLKQVEGRASLTTVTAGRDTVELRSKIARLLARRPRPTAVLTTQVPHTQTFLIYLPQLGLSIPKDISLIAGDSHPLFDMCVPELTRYSGTSERTIGHTVRVVQRLLAGHSASIKPFLIMPTFVTGKTVSRPPPDLISAE